MTPHDTGRTDDLRMTVGEYADSIGEHVPFADRDKPLCFGGNDHVEGHGCVHDTGRKERLLED